MICIIKSSLKIVWKIKIIIKQNIAFLSWAKNIFYSQRHIFLRFLKLPQHFFAEADTKKHRFFSAKASNAALVKFTDWIIKTDLVTNCAMFFCKWFKEGQTRNVIWLSTTWFLIFRLEVAKKAFIHHKTC